MATGIVKWFSNAKGYGFITSEEFNGDIFAHYSAVDMDGYKTLKRGQTVEFELDDGPKGKHARKIRLQDDETTSDSSAGADPALALEPGQVQSA
jgi:CspA family cold shock protein